MICIILKTVMENPDADFKIAHRYIAHTFRFDNFMYLISRDNFKKYIVQGLNKTVNILCTNIFLHNLLHNVLTYMNEHKM